MNKKYTITSLIVVITILLVTVASLLLYIYSDSEENEIYTSELSFEEDLSQVMNDDLYNHADNIEINEQATLTQEEISDLLYMREEEKLAHDVYTALYSEWGLNIFSNISNSEQKHTDSIATLIEAYNLDDPYMQAVGEFSNSDLQELYDQLVETGSESIIDALKVGALIEDLDIVDLENAMNRTDNQSIISVYENLQRGSRNHIRSFTSMLERYGETYTPEYLDYEEYISIITSGHETGNGNGGNGNGGNH